MVIRIIMRVLDVILDISRNVVLLCSLMTCVERTNSESRQGENNLAHGYRSKQNPVSVSSVIFSLCKVSTRASLCHENFKQYKENV